MADQWIPPGRFTTGCSPGEAECDEEDRPAHEVTITRGSWLGQTPVTQQAYQRVTGHNPSSLKGARLPVENANWSDAKSYCAIIGGRLPTEAEWEYAARAGSAGARYGNLDEIAWYSGNSGDKPHEVGQKMPNALGLYDTLGNVAQWVVDLAGPYESAAQTDPSGPGSGAWGSYRVMRAGIFFDDSKRARVSYRELGGDVAPPLFAGISGGYIGFRCLGD
jgi:formylglycine-generating enzyme required for sulfatase activity